MYLLEGPFLTHTFERKDVFNWTATYRRDSDIPVPYNRWVYYDERVKQIEKLDHNYAANKTKKVSCSIAVFVLIIGYRYVLRRPVCNAARHPNYKTVIFVISTIPKSPSLKKYTSSSNLLVSQSVCLFLHRVFIAL
jgi:hypothetical protein